MSGRHIELAAQWLVKADHDVITARQTLLLPDGPTDTPCFHAQQAAEKALKALLTVYEVVFPRTHDLVRLLDMAVAYVPALEDFRESVAALTSYAVMVRYPDEGEDPPRHEAQQFLGIAEEMVAKVRQKLADISGETTTPPS
jgi:HEPN domain-containing protein